MTDSPENGTPSPSADQPTGGGELSLRTQPPDPDQDALQVLLQASAAAESLQQRFGELQSRQAEIVAERGQLSADRTAFEQRARQFAEQVARDRSNQREVTAELEHRQHEVSQRQTEQEQQQSLIDQTRQELEAKRARLHDAVNEELARERAVLQRQQNTLDQERQRTAERAEQLEQQHRDRMQQHEEAVQTERETMRESVRQELSAELDEIHRERQEWASQKEAQTAELLRETEDLQQQRELFGEQLDAEQQRLRGEIEKRRQTLLTEQNNLQRRYRFQFEHLARSRSDFEVELREMRGELQLFRSERKAFDEQHRRRFGQLQKIRETLSEREESLKREQKVVDRNRVGTELDLKRQHTRLQEHQEAVLQDLDSRTRRIHQSEQSSADASHRLDQRLQHVNQLRTELDSRQREVLEQRLLLEELQATVQMDDPKYSTSRQSAKDATERFFEQLHVQLKSEHLRLEAKATDLADKQEQFRKDRNDLEQWFADRAAQVGTPSQDVDSEEMLGKFAAVEEELASTRKEWLSERKDAEATIRRLLDQIASSEVQTFSVNGPIITQPTEQADDTHAATDQTPGCEDEGDSQNQAA